MVRFAFGTSPCSRELGLGAGVVFSFLQICRVLLTSFDTLFGFDSFCVVLEFGDA
jgi:hypothetical protein